MNKVNNIISSVYRFATTVFLFVVRTILEAVKKIIKATISLYNFLIERKWKIFFVLILPIIANYLLVTNLERGTCVFELPVSSHQDDLIECGKALSGLKIDTLSRISPGLAELLRYNFSIKNNFYIRDKQTLITTSTLMIIENEKTEIVKKLSADEPYYVVTKDLSYSEAVDKLKKYTPVLLNETPGSYELFGGWELKYQPDIFSVVIQFLVTLLVWFQFVCICTYLKE